MQPFLRGCRSDNLDYRGIIYAGLMLTSDGPRVLEFNVRFGDPEAQAVLTRMTSDLAEAMLYTIDNRLAEYEFTWSDSASACVVMVSEGYPGSYQKGSVINGISDAEDLSVNVFHAGTEKVDQNVVAVGGRVLGVTATGASIPEAVERAYAAVNKIDWEDAFFRRDIAKRAIAQV